MYIKKRSIFSLQVIFLDSFLCCNTITIDIFFKTSNIAYHKAILGKKVKTNHRNSLQDFYGVSLPFPQDRLKTENSNKPFARLWAPIPILLSLRRATIYGHMSPSGGKCWNWPKTVLPWLMGLVDSRVITICWLFALIQGTNRLCKQNVHDFAMIIPQIIIIIFFFSFLNFRATFQQC